MIEKTPWSAWLALAARAFALSPREFWRLSLREWRALAAPARVGLTRSELNTLASRFPDAQG
jgi:hypothetical protein